MSGDALVQPVAILVWSEDLLRSTGALHAHIHTRNVRHIFKHLARVRLPPADWAVQKQHAVVHLSPKPLAAVAQEAAVRTALQ